MTVHQDVSTERRGGWQRRVVDTSPPQSLIGGIRGAAGVRPWKLDAVPMMQGGPDEDPGIWQAAKAFVAGQGKPYRDAQFRLVRSPGFLLEHIYDGITGRLIPKRGRGDRQS